MPRITRRVAKQAAATLITPDVFGIHHHNIQLLPDFKSTKTDGYQDFIDKMCVLCCGQDNEGGQEDNNMLL